MTLPTEEDEGTHTPGPDRFWNESFYFNFFDGASGIAGAARIGFSPNRDHRDGFLLLHAPDGTSGFVRMHAPLARREHGRAQQPIEAGPLAFVCESPMQRWRVRYEGPLFVSRDPGVFGDPMRLACVDVPRRPLTLDLEFESLHAPWDFHGGSAKRLVAPRPEVLVRDPILKLGSAVRALKALPSMSRAAHYEQAVRVRGTLRLDGTTHTIAGTGQRDHSYGVRDMRVPSSWRWISFQLGEGFAVNATKVRVLALEASSGYVFRGGRPTSLRGFRTSADASADGTWPDAFMLELDLDDETLAIEVDVLRQLPIAVDTDGHGSVVNEALARFSHRGQRSLGIVEAMSQRGP